MDMTEKYIKMCEKAEEVQKSYFEVFRKSEFRYNFLDWICLDKSFYHIDNDLRTVIWLPRQDQLQEMVKENDKGDYSLLISFRMWLNSIPFAYSQVSIMSMEQLWLAFVMKEKYDKVWDDKNEKWEVLNGR